MASSWTYFTAPFFQAQFLCYERISIFKKGDIFVFQMTIYEQNLLWSLFLNYFICYHWGYVFCEKVVQCIIFSILLKNLVQSLFRYCVDSMMMNRCSLLQKLLQINFLGFQVDVLNVVNCYK